jgi:hypothetical protein
MVNPAALPSPSVAGHSPSVVVRPPRVVSYVHIRPGSSLLRGFLRPTNSDPAFVWKHRGCAKQCLRDNEKKTFAGMFYRAYIMPAWGAFRPHLTPATFNTLIGMTSHRFQPDDHAGLTNNSTASTLSDKFAFAAIHEPNARTFSLPAQWLSYSLQVTARPYISHASHPL